MLTEILIVVALTIVNGLLAMSELAVVSSRTARLKVLSDQGSRGAATAMRLAEDPGRFLSTVQIGITLVGVLSGAFSGATLGARLSEWLGTQGFSPSVSDTLGVGIVVVAITYLSLILGELVPKQIALRDPERVAARLRDLPRGGTGGFEALLGELALIRLLSTANSADLPDDRPAAVVGQMPPRPPQQEPPMTLDRWFAETFLGQGRR